MIVGIPNSMMHQPSSHVGLALAGGANLDHRHGDRTAANESYVSSSSSAMHLPPVVQYPYEYTTSMEAAMEGPHATLLEMEPPLLQEEENVESEQLLEGEAEEEPVKLFVGQVRLLTERERV